MPNPPKADATAEREFGNGILAEAEPSFFEADVALLADDEVVEHFDVEELACFHNLLCDLDVLGTGRGVSRRVVVHHHGCVDANAPNLGQV